MITPVAKYVDAFIKAGADIISFHPDADKDSLEIIQEINRNNVKSGIAIHPHVKVADFEHMLPNINQVIIMTVIPGFGGQKFMHDQVSKIRELYDLRKNKNYNFNISVDGGINNETAKLCKKNGVDILAVGSFLLSKDKKDYGKLIELLR